jgi:hypothetical protein
MPYATQTVWANNPTDNPADPVCGSGWYPGWSDGKLVCVRMNNPTSDPGNGTTATSASNPPTSTPTLLASIIAHFSALPFMAPDVGQPTQILYLTVNGGAGAPYEVALYVRSPNGTRSFPVHNMGNTFTVIASWIGDSYFGTNVKGGWDAWFTVTSGAQNATSNNAVWYVSTYPVHEVP